VLVTSLCFWLPFACDFPLLLTSLCFLLPFAFGFATQRQKASNLCLGRTFSLLAKAKVAQRISKGGKRQAKAKGKQRQKATQRQKASKLMPAAHKQGRQKTQPLLLFLLPSAATG
jgi:hypothetical protein